MFSVDFCYCFVSCHLDTKWLSEKTSSCVNSYDGTKWCPQFNNPAVLNPRLLPKLSELHKPCALCASPLRSKRAHTTRHGTPRRKVPLEQESALGAGKPASKDQTLSGKSPAGLLEMGREPSGKSADCDMGQARLRALSAARGRCALEHARALP